MLTPFILRHSSAYKNSTTFQDKISMEHNFFPEHKFNFHHFSKSCSVRLNLGQIFPCNGSIKRYLKDFLGTCLNGCLHVWLCFKGMVLGKGKIYLLYKIQLYLTRLWPSKNAVTYLIYLNIYR